MPTDVTFYNIIVLTWNILMVILTIVYAIVLYAKKRKAKQSRLLENAETTPKTTDGHPIEEIDPSKETVFDKIYNRLLGYIEAAEVANDALQSVAGVSGMKLKLGPQKMADVLSKVKIDCMSENVAYDENLWKRKVEELISFSKKVNSK